MSRYAQEQHFDSIWPERNRTFISMSVKEALFDYTAALEKTKQQQKKDNKITGKVSMNISEGEPVNSFKQFSLWAAT